MTGHIEMQKHEIAAENNAMDDMTAVIGKLIKRVIYIVACMLLLLMTGKWPRQKTGAELAVERVRAKHLRNRPSPVTESVPEDARVDWGGNEGVKRRADRLGMEMPLYYYVEQPFGRGSVMVPVIE